MDNNLAEIIGLLCAEGSYILQYSTYMSYDRGRFRLFKNHKSERIELYNKDTNLLLHYRDLLLLEFNYKANITKNNKINLCNRKIIRVLISYTQLGHLKWKVPDEVLKSENIFLKTSFIRGYFDGDGTSSNSIRMFSTNKKGITQVAFLLNQLNIKNTLQKPIIKENRKPIFTLQVSRKAKERFLNLINPISKLPGNARVNNQVKI